MYLLAETVLKVSNNSEQKYAPTHLEVAALVYSVEHFEVYLLGQLFAVYTDHQLLVSAFIVHLKSQTKGLFVCWYLQLARFLPNMNIEYKPEATNVVADAFLRAAGQSESDGTSVTVEGSDALQLSEPDSTLQQVQTDQCKDPELARLIDFLTDKRLEITRDSTRDYRVRGTYRESCWHQDTSQTVTRLVRLNCIIV